MASVISYCVAAVVLSRIRTVTRNVNPRTLIQTVTLTLTLTPTLALTITLNPASKFAHILCLFLALAITLTNLR